MGLAMRKLQNRYGIAPYKEWAVAEDVFKFGTKVSCDEPKHFTEFQFIDVEIINAKAYKTDFGAAFRYRDPELRKKYVEKYCLGAGQDVKEEQFSNQIVRVGSEFDGKIVKGIKENKFGTNVIITFEKGKPMTINKERIVSLKRVKEE